LSLYTKWLPIRKSGNSIPIKTVTKEVFENFFRGAIESKGAFKIIEKETGAVLGSSRFYDYDEAENSIFIGYTFYGTKSWGKGINPQIKKLMLDYIFQFVDLFIFISGKKITVPRLLWKDWAERKSQSRKSRISENRPELTLYTKLKRRIIFKTCLS
jgi:hypothetical protein